MAPPKKWDDESEDDSSEDESVDVKPVTARRRFEDEEDSDDVADNWDEAEDSEEERAKAAKAAAAKAKADADAAKNKKSKSQRIEEHREANRKKKISEMDDEEDSEEDEADRRERLRQTEQDSDLKHAEDLFSAVDINKKRGTSKAVVIENADKPGEAIDLSSLPLFKPATKPQFEALSEVLVPLLRASSSKPHYSIWITNFCKQICSDIPSSEIKKVASALTALSNEKMKEEKMADKTGKKTKAAKTKTTLSAGRDMGRGVADTTAYDDNDLDDGDFM